MKYYSFLLILAALVLGNQLLAQQPDIPRPANFEDVGVFRIQLTFTTADISDAGTDDGVAVQLNGSMPGFYLNLAKDDRERNSVETYDIITPSVKTIKDIKFIQISKGGSDGWAIKKAELRINNKLIYVYQNQFGPVWLDNSVPHTNTLMISSEEIRRSSLWNYNGDRSNIQISPSHYNHDELKEITESFWGNYLHSVQHVEWGDYDNNNTQFGDDAELKKSTQNNTTMSVDLDFKEPHTINLEIDVDYEMVLTCSPQGQPVVSVQNYYWEKPTGGRKKRDVAELKPLCDYLSRIIVKYCKSSFYENGSLVFWI